jgi:hypothetical protein
VELGLSRQRRGQQRGFEVRDRRSAVIFASRRMSIS